MRKAARKGLKEPAHFEKWKGRTRAIRLNTGLIYESEGQGVPFARLKPNTAVGVLV